MLSRMLRTDVSIIHIKFACSNLPGISRKTIKKQVSESMGQQDTRDFRVPDHAYSKPDGGGCYAGIRDEVKDPGDATGVCFVHLLILEGPGRRLHDSSKRYVFPFHCYSWNATKALRHRPNSGTKIPGDASEVDDGRGGVRLRSHRANECVVAMC